MGGAHGPDPPAIGQTVITWSRPLQGSLGNVVSPSAPREGGHPGPGGLERTEACGAAAWAQLSVLPQSGAMEGEPLQTFYTQLVLMPKVMHYAQYALLALGGALLLVPLVHQARSQVGDCAGTWVCARAGPGVGSIRPHPSLCRLLAPLAPPRTSRTCVASALPVLGPPRGPQPALGGEAWLLNYLFSKWAPAECQAAGAWGPGPRSGSNQAGIPEAGEKRKTGS